MLPSNIEWNNNKALLFIVYHLQFKHFTNKDVIS